LRARVDVSLRLAVVVNFIQDASALVLRKHKIGVGGEVGGFFGRKAD
jgi:hypothetical protein